MNKEIQRGNDAKRVLDEPLLKEAFEAVEAALIAEIRRVDIGNAAKQQNLVTCIQLLGKVRGYIESVVNTGQMAAIAEEQKGWADRFRRRA
jgi:hypothetical protein